MSTAPKVVAFLLGGAVLCWMFWLGGVMILMEWYVYPSLVAFLIIGYTLVREASVSVGRRLWWIIMWWSGLWAILFVLAFIAPPLSTMLVASVVSWLFETFPVNPFLAGLIHVVMWACAREAYRAYRY